MYRYRYGLRCNAVYQSHHVSSSRNYPAINTNGTAFSIAFIVLNTVYLSLKVYKLVDSVRKLKEFAFQPLLNIFVAEGVFYFFGCLSMFANFCEIYWLTHFNLLLVASGVTMVFASGNAELFAYTDLSQLLVFLFCSCLYVSSLGIVLTVSAAGLLHFTATLWVNAFLRSYRFILIPAPKGMPSHSPLALHGSKTKKKIHWIYGRQRLALPVQPSWSILSWLRWTSSGPRVQEQLAWVRRARHGFDLRKRWFRYDRTMGGIPQGRPFSK